MLITYQMVKIFYTTIPIINAVSDQTGKLLIKVLIRYIHDFQRFDVEYGIHFMSEIGYFIFSRVRNTS